MNTSNVMQAFTYFEVICVIPGRYMWHEQHEILVSRQRASEMFSRAIYVRISSLSKRLYIRFNFQYLY